MAGHGIRPLKSQRRHELILQGYFLCLRPQASLTVDDASIKAESMLKKALQLADTQFVGNPLQRQLQINI